MQFISDLHIHSKYARATSKQLDLEHLEKFAKIKGLDLLGTGDFTHPEWIKELKTKLKDDGTGILRTATGFPFILQTELSLVYTQGGKGRRVHHLILAPSFDVVDQITQFLLSKGRIDYDGRPIFGLSSIVLAEKLHEISPDTELIPAHVWTPYFGVLGSKSGFDSLKECFQDKTHLIHSIETGMSSDPAMNWRIPELDNFTLTSNSDCHSFWPWRIGREANIFDFPKLTYKNVISAIRERKGFSSTIEVDPGYGKYHVDGHRSCNVSFEPQESKKHNNICPGCKRPLTIGVLSRVEQLAKRDDGFVPNNAIPFMKFIPLSEIISALNKTSVSSKKTWAIYNSMIASFGNEFEILINASEEDLKKAAEDDLVKAIMNNREGKIVVKPGYDGVYGVPLLGEIKDEPKIIQKSVQKGINDYS